VNGLFKAQASNFCAEVASNGRRPSRDRQQR
jgi:hypothetical protein